MNTEVKLIFTAGLAKKLLKKGYRIIDIKPNKYITGRTVFIFEDKKGLKEAIKQLTKKTK